MTRVERAPWPRRESDGLCGRGCDTRVCTEVLGRDARDDSSRVVSGASPRWGVDSDVSDGRDPRQDIDSQSPTQTRRAWCPESSAP